MFKTITQLAVLAGFLLAFSGCYLIRKSQAASEGSNSPSNRTVANTQSECNADNYMDFIYTEGTHNCDLRGADLREKDLSGANFKGADCREADFWLTRLNKADFTGANCAGANFDRAIARETIFKDTNLQDAEMRWVLGVDFSSVYFDGAILTGTKVDKVIGLDYAISQGAMISPYSLWDYWYDNF